MEKESRTFIVPMEEGSRTLTFPMEKFLQYYMCPLRNIFHKFFHIIW